MNNLLPQYSLVQEESRRRPKALIVDDEPQIRRLLKLTLEAEGYAVREAELGSSGLTEAAFTRPDLIILDLGLPDISGIEFIKRLREWSAVPVLVLSVRSSQLDKVTALDIGADDYLTKPFDPSELFARLRVLRRRLHPNDEPTVVGFGTVQVDLMGHTVTKDGREVRLTATEYALLNLLITNRGKIVTHKQTLRELWGPGCENRTNYLRVYMGRLRQKLEDDPNQPRFLLTASGFGYRLNADGPAHEQPAMVEVAR
jgi:two-component system KDP operon response regulator KdpE